MPNIPAAATANLLENDANYKFTSPSEFVF